MNSTRNFNLLIPQRQRIVLPTDENNNNNIQASIEILLARIGIYAAILGTIFIVVFLIFKYLGSCNDSGRAASETEPLVPQKIIGLPYGTDEDDEGYTTAGSSSNSDDLYDGKICVICYDTLRNCFFIPCGHCATCHDCAMRIMEVENRVCPICRRFIHKVKRVLIP